MNNMLGNLEIITCKQNTQHAISNKRKKYKIVYQYNDKLQIINTFYNICDAVSNTGISRSKIVANLGAKKPSLTSEGHYWSYNSQLTFSDISVATNQGISKKVAQYTLDGVFVREYSSCGEAKRINFPDMKRGTGHISECCRGKIKQYKGYVWKYKDDIV
nr:MAG TPA: intron associated endonuclease [Caudoviricetes sp.]